MVDTGTIVSLAIVAIGILMAVGASSEGAVSERISLSVSDNPSKGWRAYSEDMDAGLNAGSVFVVAGMVWLLFVVTIYKLQF